MALIDGSLPDVSIVVPNWNGKHHLDRCFESLNQLSYPGHVELILVDNGSVDGSVAHMRRRFPRVELIENVSNTGFAAACNAGADRSRSEVVAFLNNDMRVEPDWLTQLVEPIAAKETRCTASLILSWDGSVVNFGGGAMNFHGIGIQQGMNDADVEAYRKADDTLFACGGAMAIDRDLFLRCGGFDNEFFAYYEDVDLGWRLWVIGETVRYVPTSIAYHHHSATSGRVDVHRIRLLQIRNPLYAIFKNYDDEHLKAAFPAALLLTLRRTKYLLDLDEREFSLVDSQGMRQGIFGGLRTRGAARLQGATVPMAGLADILAINDLISGFDALVEKRRWIQAERKRDDKEIIGLFRDPTWAAERSEEYAGLQDDLLRFFGLEEALRATDR